MKIVVLDGYTLNPGDLSWAELASLGEVRVYARTAEDEILSRAEGADALLTNKTPLHAETLAQLPGLKYIGVLATGYNVVDIDAARAKSISVTNIPDYGTQSVAQMVMGHILAFCHRIESHSEAVKNGAWTNAPDWCFWQSPQIELAGKTLGIIGLGRIGHQVARLASAFGMRVQATAHHQRPINDIPDFRWASLPDLLRTSDFISLNCPLTPQTEGLINRERLSLMKPSAFLINTARGGLIVEADLAEALNTGMIAGAGLDVLSSEPPSADNPLPSAQDVIITPHMAWATREARQRLINLAVSNLSAYLRGQPQNLV